MKKRITRTIAYVLVAGMITGSIIPNNCSLAKENNVVSGIEEKENKEAEWNLKAIEVDEVTKQDTVSLKKIKIAVLDSGVDYSENVNVVERKDFLGEDISPLFEDGTGHGTAVAAVIGSNGENDTIKGINPNVEIYSAKILDNNNKASIDRVVKAIDWAIEKKVNIINMSFGRKGDSVTLHNAIRRAKRAGILMIASSGNGGSSEEGNVEYPAAYDEVVAVGAVTPEGTLSDMTSTGDELELLAPGEYIKTTGWLDSECISSGTSFAVPHVTAIASLLWQKNFTKSAEYIRNLLRASAKTVIGEDGKEYSLVDYEYACKIYDEYNEQYTEGADAEDIIEEFENTDEADDYSEEVEGRWSKEDHEETVIHANNCLGGLTTAELKIVKIGVRAPDVWYTASRYNGKVKESNPYGLDLRMFHAIEDYNYVKVYEYIMSMALECKKSGINSAQSISFPNYNAGNYNECFTVKAQLNKACINNILYGNSSDVLYKYAYSNKRAALVMLGFAMHVVADTYAHKAYEYDYNKNKWIHLTPPDARENKKAKGERRFTYAKFAINKILNVWNKKNSPSFLEYNIQGHSNDFRLRGLYEFSLVSPNSVNFYSFEKDISKLSCPFTCNK